MNLNCQVCHKLFRTYPCLVRDGKGKFCSPACSQKIPKTKTHGQSRTRLYRVWMNMRRRCADPNNTKYRYYGGRGITVCDEWRNSFAAFSEWAKSAGYRDDLEIDRRDNSLGYCPSNCRMATKSQQSANTRKRNDGSRSQFRGTYWSGQSNKWVARVHVNGRSHQVGSFTSEIDAAKAYDIAAMEYFGEFASPNFPTRR